MKIFDAQYLDGLTNQAKDSPRLRQHRNVHQSYQEASQRLFNAIEPGSYIRKLTQMVNKLKIETSISLRMRDEEVEIHGKSNCWDIGRR